VSPTAVIEISRTHNPYPRHGVRADDHGIPRYTDLPESLIAMLARHVETGPDMHIVDRIKDIIIRGGENVSSIEVESALLAAPGVAEAAVIAVPDDVMGEKVGAVLFGGAETVDVPQVLAHCREQLADFKIPQYIVVADGPLPRNPGGRLLKAQLRTSIEWGAPL
jgi:acyl-CoA synthetase (AMP-forming)/AMP-acid ligase II